MEAFYFSSIFIIVALIAATIVLVYVWYLTIKIVTRSKKYYVTLPIIMLTIFLAGTCYWSYFVMYEIVYPAVIIKYEETK